MAQAITEHNTHRVPMMATGVTFTFLGTVIVFARLFIRGVSTRSLGQDDIVIFAAWVASIGFAISQAIAIRYGVGLFLQQTTLDGVSKALEATYFVELFYYISIYLIKVSILLFYLRLVEGLWGKFYNCTLVCLGLVTTQFISTIIVVFLQCRPISFYWDSTQPGSCIDITKFFYSTNGFTIASDLIILALPIPTLSKVRRSRQEKVALLGVFGAGALSTLASCIRLYTIKIYTKSTDPTYDVGPIGTWSFIEINLGKTCASGPALKAFFCVVKDSLSTMSLTMPSRNSIAVPSESEVELGLRTPQAPLRKASNGDSFYKMIR